MKMSKFNGLKALVKAHSAEIAAAGAGVGAAGAGVLSQIPVTSMQTDTDAINSSISMLGTMLGDFSNIIPPLISFVVALVPLIFIGIIIGLVVYIFRDWVREILGVMFR
jgi:uncharacterized membrane protein